MNQRPIPQRGVASLRGLQVELRRAEALAAEPLGDAVDHVGMGAAAIEDDEYGPPGAPTMYGSKD